MPTRRRERHANIRARLNQDLNHRVSTFHPIIQAVVQYLQFRDCAAVSQCAREFYTKVWMHMLRQPHNQTIDVDDKSLIWIAKYAAYLKHQTLQIYTKERSHRIIEFKSCNIAWLKRLEVHSRGGEFPTLPLNLEELSFFNLTSRMGVVKMNMVNITKFEVAGVYIENEINAILNQLPASLQHLRILSYGLRFRTCPVFPNVTKLFLFVGSSLHSIDDIQNKFPLLRDLTLGSNEFDGVAALDGLCGASLTRLTIRSRKLIDLSPLAHVKIEELDIRECPNIDDFSYVQHIPVVKKPRTLQELFRSQ